MTAQRPRPKVPTILLTNDDGPPGPASPFVHAFLVALKKGIPEWQDIRVVLPNSQRSWIGKAYLIDARLKGEYYYTPLTSGSGLEGERRPTRRPLSSPDEAEWILLDGTPASCTNIGTHSLYPNEIDLVLSGPNCGRNTSSAFSLSSGTVGAALDGALTGIPAIALSYGLFDKPPLQEVIAVANEIAVKVIKRLWESGFEQGGDADLYSVNIPLVPSIITERKVVWTSEAHTRYSRLFASTSNPPNPSEPLDFSFSPDISALIDAKVKAHEDGTDADALNRGFVTVSPLKAAFKPAGVPEGFAEGRVWKL